MIVAKLDFDGGRRYIFVELDEDTIVAVFGSREINSARLPIKYRAIVAESETSDMVYFSDIFKVITGEGGKPE